MLKKLGNYRNKIQKALRFFRAVEIPPFLLVLPVILSLFASVFEGVTMGLLIPLANGIITMNFDEVLSQPVIGPILTFVCGQEPRRKVIFLLLVVLVFLAAAIKLILTYCASLNLAYVIRKLANKLRQSIFGRYLSFGKLFYDRNSAGRLQQILLGFTQHLADIFARNHFVIGEFFILTAYVTILFFISWKLTLIVLLMFPLLNRSLDWLIRKISKTSVDCAVWEKELAKKAYDVLTCAALVKNYTNEKREKKEFEKISDQLASFQFSIDKKYNFIHPFQEMVMLTALLVLISGMAFLVFRETGAGSIGSFLVYFLVLKRTIANFGVVNQLKACWAEGLGPLTEVMNIFDDSDKFVIVSGSRECQGLRDEIRFKDVCFSYTPEREVLSRVDLVISKGKITALVGPTGAGKTTIVSLILRYYDRSSGEITFDGVDIKEFRLDSLISQMACVSQDIPLFNDTIHQNIIYGLNRPIPDTEVKQVVESARLNDLVERLPQGLETIIGDRGVQLSGGEKQRVAIARALLKQAEILILDEATSSLDSSTEKLIQEAIDNLVKNKTAIVIAHRLSTIRNADKIIVIEDGCVREEGSLNDLLERKGRFFQYWQEQKFS